MSVDSGDDRPAEIELRLGAELTSLPIIRSLTSTIAMRADFDLDAIADLKLAVDEACSTLIVRAAADTNLCCRYTITGDEIRFVVSIEAKTAATPSSESFGWRVLTTLTDRARTWVEADGHPGGRQVNIELAKRRADGPA